MSIHAEYQQAECAELGVLGRGYTQEFEVGLSLYPDTVSHQV